MDGSPTIKRTFELFEDLCSEYLSRAPDLEDTPHLGLNLGGGALVGMRAALDDDGVERFEEVLALADSGLLEDFWTR